MFVFDRAKALLQDWKSATFIRGASSTHQQPERISKWVKPSPGRFKCNVDASFSEISNMVGIGMCIMDENGTFVLTKQECFSPSKIFLQFLAPEKFLIFTFGPSTSANQGYKTCFFEI